MFTAALFAVFLCTPGYAECTYVATAPSQEFCQQLTDLWNTPDPASALADSGSRFVCEQRMPQWEPASP